jgi:hypothetical protein
MRICYNMSRIYEGTLSRTYNRPRGRALSGVWLGNMQDLKLQIMDYSFRYSLFYAGYNRGLKREVLQVKTVSFKKIYRLRNRLLEYLEV